MDSNLLNKLKNFYDEYVEFSWSNDFQFNFWKIKLDEVANRLTVEEMREVSNRPSFYSESIFATYDIPVGGSGWLNVRNSTKAITKETITGDKNAFLQEIVNLSFVRYQNALERLLIQAINECFIKISQFDVYDRKCLSKLFNTLGFKRQDNSMHLLTYLESKNSSIEDFFNSKCNVDLNCTWKELFNFLGFIRNTIVHNGMLMQWNNYKRFIPIDNDVFHYFFEEPKKSKMFELKPRLDRVGLAGSYSDQFATNSIKLIANQNDLRFLGFYPS